MSEPRTLSNEFPCSTPRKSTRFKTLIQGTKPGKPFNITIIRKTLKDPGNLGIISRELNSGFDPAGMEHSGRYQFASFLVRSPNSLMWQQLWDYCTQPLVLTVLTGVSVGIFVIGFLLVPPLAVKLPADHFVRHEESNANRSFRDWVWYVSRNLFALIMLAAGLAMIVLPGPGIITIIVAIALADFPGKRRVERWFIRTWIVRTALNAMRNKYGAPPMIIPEADGNFIAQDADNDVPSGQSRHATENPYEPPQVRER